MTVTNATTTKRALSLSTTLGDWTRYTLTSSQQDTKLLAQAKKLIVGPLNDLAYVPGSGGTLPKVSDAPNYGMRYASNPAALPVVLRNKANQTAVTFFLSYDAEHSGQDWFHQDWPSEYTLITVIFKGTKLVANNIVFAVPNYSQKGGKGAAATEVAEYPYVVGDQPYDGNLHDVDFSALPKYSSIIDQPCMIAESIESAVNQVAGYTYSGPLQGGGSSGSGDPSSVSDNPGAILLSTALSAVYRNFGSIVCALDYSGGNPDYVKP
ncbi:MAG: hypothetical protein V4479_15990 [Actinomycetota bacterium]